MNLDRWNLLARVLRAPDDGTGAASAATAAATPAADAAPPASAAASAAPAAEAAAPVSSAAPAASESPAAPAATDAPAAKESTPSLLGAAEAKLPAKEAKEALPDQGSEAGKTAEAAKPATAESKTDATKPDAPKDPAKDPAAAKEGTDGKKDETAPAKEALAEKPQARTYDAFKVPEGLRLDDKQVTDFTSVLENSELSHQERAQKLVDMHVGEVDRVVKEQRTNQLNAWSDFTDGLKSDFKKDPELGGNRQETSLGIAKYVLEQLGGTPEQVADHVRMLDHTGMGNYVGSIRLLNTIYERYLAEGKPVPGSAPTRAARGNFQDVMYGGQGNGAGG